MVECDKCPDKLRCTTGKKDACDRGFKLKMCCRKHLAGKKEEILKMLIDVPNEMIVGTFVTYEDICPMCDDKIIIRLQMANSCNDEVKRLQDELDALKRLRDLPRPEPYEPPYRDTTGPYTLPGNPYVLPNSPIIGDFPSDKTFCKVSSGTGELFADPKDEDFYVDEESLSAANV